MRPSARLQLLICLMVYASSAHAVMVKFGTKGGPIEPPTPEPALPSSRQYRSPAPVWEERSSDVPDPNAQWRPQLFKPQPRYTHVVYSAPAPTQLSLSNAQRFVNSYIPTVQPKVAERTYFTPSQVLSSQNLPGVGLRYFVPIYINDSQKRVQSRQEDAKHNRVETNDVDGANEESASDLQWKYEKEASKRSVRNTQEAFVVAPVYEWPVYVHPRHR